MKKVKKKNCKKIQKNANDISAAFKSKQHRYRNGYSTTKGISRMIKQIYDTFDSGT